MLATTFIDFLMSNSTSVPVINALYTYGLSLLIHCWIQFADALFGVLASVFVSQTSLSLSWAVLSLFCFGPKGFFDPDKLSLLTK